MKSRRFDYSISTLVLLIAASLIILSADLASAKPIQQKQAQQAAAGWLKNNPKPMGRDISANTKQSATLTDDQGQTLCYVINLEPEGFVIVSPDDQIEPIIAFSSTGSYQGGQDSTLTAMLKKDMPQRLENIDLAPARHKQKKAKKWNNLLSSQQTYENDSLDIQALSASSIDDIRVEPFLTTEWSQSDVLSDYCYNYYTPNNYVCGCVATAMAQLMRYYSFPTSGIGVSSYTITVDGTSQSASTRGGNGSGGAYSWSDMPEVPASGLTTTQRQAIGALCYDAAVSVRMSFTSTSSGASLYYTDQRFTDLFDYSNSIYGKGFSVYGDAQLWAMINSNLDAKMPVILGISRSGGGHAVIADGYGYNSSTPYHHINMGWGGTDNAWYQLPLIDASYTYTMIDDCIYNVYISGTGEIISGQVTDLSGAAVSGAAVTAYIGTSEQKSTTTDDNGIYALTNLPSVTQYRINVVKAGESFMDQYVTTGTSMDSRSYTGNVCQIDFQSAQAGPPTAFDVEITDVNSLATSEIFLQALDDGLPDPNYFHYVIESMPAHGKLSEPNVGTIDTAPYTMDTASTSVLYTPCPYYGGTDTFTYLANDGGTSPDGGDSNTATVTIEVQNETTTGVHTDSHTYSSVLLWSNYYSVRNQVIYYPSEIGGEKRITALAIKVHTAPGSSLSDWTIRMKHTSRDYYNSITQIETSGWTTVYQSDQTLSTDWNWFVFDTPFDYNGTDNLMIDFSFQNASTTSSGYSYIFSASQNRNLAMIDTSGSLGSPLNWYYYNGWAYTQTTSIPALQLLSVPAIDPLVGDVDSSCDVSMPDLALMSQSWQTTDTDAEYLPECDLTTIKGTIDLSDLALMVENWLREYTY